MSWELEFQAIETAAVVAGVAFGLIQLRHIRVQREIETAVELLHPLQAPDFAEAVLLVHSLPDGLSEEALRQRLGDHFGTVLALLSVFESLGPLIARGYIPLDLYAQFYRGPTVLCWTRLRAYIEARRRSDWPMLFEWLQWLAEQIEKRFPDEAEVPAFEQFKTWASSSDYERLSKSRET